MTSASSVADPGGLTDDEVAQRVAAGQTNKAPNPNSRSLGSIVRENTVTSFNIVIGTLWALMIAARAPFQDSLFGFVIIFTRGGIRLGIVFGIRSRPTGGAAGFDQAGCLSVGLGPIQAALAD